jgi:hypothetical protein
MIDTAVGLVAESEGSERNKDKDAEPEEVAR